MAGFIVPILVGILCIVIGILNTKENISSLHVYHRYRVREEDRIPFGRMVGAGTIIIGCTIIVFSGLSIATHITNNELYTLIGTVILFSGIVVGCCISFYAMKKYNKGIF